MKKGPLLFSFPLLFLLTSCTAPHALQPDDKSMVINIQNNTDFEFQGVEVRLGRAIQGVSYADGSPVQEGDVLQVEFLDEEDINLKGKAIAEVALVNMEGERMPLEAVTLELSTNSEYSFAVTGTSITEADLEIVK